MCVCAKIHSACLCSGISGSGAGGFVRVCVRVMAGYALTFAMISISNNAMWVKYTQDTEKAPCTRGGHIGKTDTHAHGYVLMYYICFNGGNYL